MAETSQMVRSYLKNLGYKDDDITYQKGASGQGGTVSLQGKHFMQGTPEADGYIRSSQSGLDAAMNQYKGNQLTTQANDTQTKQNDLLSQYQNRITQPIQPFSYDVNQIKNDPTYQAQLSSFTQDTNRGTDQALVNLGRRGIGNSQSGVVAEAAGQQNINNYANNELLPRQIAEAYSKYVDQNNMNRQQGQDILGLAGVYGDQNQTMYDRGRDQVEDTRYTQENEALRQSAIAKAEADQKKAVYDSLWKAAEQTGTLPNELADSYGLPRGTKTLDAAKVGISQQNADTSRMNAGTSAKNATTSRMNADLAKTKYTEILGGNEFSSQVVSGLGEFDNAEDAQAWLNANGEEITKQVGFNKFMELQKAIPTFFGKDTSIADAKNDQAIRSKAIGMATQDNNYYRADAKRKEEIIQEYINLIRGS